MFCGDCSTNTGQNRTQLNSRLQHQDVNDEEWRLCFVPTGLHSSYGAHAGQMDPELRAPLSPDCHMTPVFDERSFHSPVYHSPAHEAQGTLYRSNTGTAAHQVTKQLFFNSFLWIAIILRSWFHWDFDFISLLSCSLFVPSGMGTLPRASSHCGTQPYQRSSYGMANPGLYVESYRLSGEPVFSHRHSALVDRVTTRTPSIESIHKDPRYRHLAYKVLASLSTLTCSFLARINRKNKSTIIKSSS